MFTNGYTNVNDFIMDHYNINEILILLIEIIWNLII